jgi:hypothetical protein
VNLPTATTGGHHLPRPHGTYSNRPGQRHGLARVETRCVKIGPRFRCCSDWQRFFNLIKSGYLRPGQVVGVIYNFQIKDVSVTTTLPESCLLSELDPKVKNISSA